MGATQAMLVEMLGRPEDVSTKVTKARHRRITGRHATSRDLTSARQHHVNGKFASENPEGFARRVEPTRNRQLDLEGEVLQWSLDLATPFVDPCVDCAILDY
jgi:hypothetical protein